MKRLLLLTCSALLCIYTSAQQSVSVEVMYQDSIVTFYDYVTASKDGFKVKDDKGCTLFVLYDDIHRAILHKDDIQIVLYDDISANKTQEENVTNNDTSIVRELHASEIDFPDYTVDPVVYFYGGQMAKINLKKHTIKIKEKKYPFENVLDYSVQSEDIEHSAVYETKRKGVLGRALLGNALGGSTGAIIGGTTAKYVTKMKQPASVTTEYTLKVAINDEKTPVVYLYFDEEVDKLNQVCTMLEYVLSHKISHESQGTVIVAPILSFSQKLRSEDLASHHR